MIELNLKAKKLKNHSTFETKRQFLRAWLHETRVVLREREEVRQDQLRLQAIKHQVRAEQFSRKNIIKRGFHNLKKILKA